MKSLKWVLLAGVIVAGLAYGQEASVASLKGKQVPAFKMTTFAGKKISNASLKGKPYILDFWATWCGPCKAASPTMQSLHSKYASKGLVVIGANMGEEAGTAKEALNYPKKHNYTYTFTTKNDDFAAKLGIQGIPCFIFVDKTGKVVAVETGFDSSAPKIFEGYVKKML